MNTAYHGIAVSQSSVLYENGGHRPPAGIYLGFNYVTVCQFVRIGFQFQYFRL